MLPVRQGGGQASQGTFDFVGDVGRHGRQQRYGSKTVVEAQGCAALVATRAAEDEEAATLHLNGIHTPGQLQEGVPQVHEGELLRLVEHDGSANNRLRAGLHNTPLIVYLSMNFLRASAHIGNTILT